MLGCNKDNRLDLSAGVFWLHMNWLSRLDSHRCVREACVPFQRRKIQNYELEHLECYLGHKPLVEAFVPSQVGWDDLSEGSITNSCNLRTHIYFKSLLLLFVVLA